MKINDGNGLPLAGFFEMKQEVYEIRYMLKKAEEKLELHKNKKENMMEKSC